MGDYFKDEQPKEEVDSDDELIANFEDLCAAYDALSNKIQVTTNQGYEAILPIRTELSGGGKTPDDIGQVGTLRRRIENSRIYRMDIGMMMWNTLKNIEDLDRWSERYAEYLEKHMDGLKIICRSSFKIIVGLHKELQDLNVKVLKLNDQIISQVDILPKPGMEQIEIEKAEPKPPRKKTAAKEKIVEPEFMALLEKRLQKYKEAKKTGDVNKINVGKLQVLNIIERDKNKRNIVEKELAKVDSKSEPDENMIYSPLK